MEKRDRDNLSQQLTYTEKRRSVAHLYSNKFSATLPQNREGRKKELLGINIKPLQEDSTVSKQCCGVQRKTAFALPSSIF